MAAPLTPLKCRRPTPSRGGDATQAADDLQRMTATNYAGRTYKDYLAANPQASTPAPQKN